ncbi:MAG: phosphoglycerate dehydrogenase [Phycisphaerales bacterium]|jgi:D-3-phosphoglycerate dehydrogenase|nr:phosphoglycerate dehydrogenase [Phycisphaerales bacterium]
MPALNGKIVLLEGIHEAAEGLLEQTGLEVTRIPGSLDPNRLREIAADAAVLCIRSRTRIDRALIESAPALTTIGCFCIGTNQVDLEAAAERGVAVFNAPFSNTRSVAELTLAELVMLLRRIPQRNADMHSGRWRKSASGSHEVRGRTLGIIGYGHIGTQLSVLAEALGMRVIYHDIIAKLPIGNAHSSASLEELLSESDVVSLHVPATAGTRGMIGSQELAGMKRGSFLINNARGDIVDIDALAKALDDEHLAGAAVDVFPEEPKSGDSEFSTPLAGRDNVILTPHIGGNTLEAQAAIGGEVGEKIRRFIREGATGTAVNLPNVDLPSRRDGQHRILHFHRNVPGVLGRMHTVLAGLNVNITAEFLQSSGDLSYVILDVDPIEIDRVQEEISKIPETIRIRTII